MRPSFKTGFRRTFVSLIALSLMGFVSGCSPNEPSPSGNSTNAVTLSSGSPSSIAQSSKTLTNKWMKIDKGKRHVDLTLDAEMNNSFSFDGYQQGFLTVTVPKGWLVTVNFTNLGILMDSAIVLSQSTFKTFLNNGQLPTPAFPNAETTSPTQGLGEDMTDTFTFKASKSGQYVILSGIQGHAMSGMWIHFNVSDSAKLPSATLK